MCEVQPSTCYTFQLDEVLDHISQGYKDVWTAIWQQIRPFSKAKFRKTSVDSSLLFLIQVCIFFRYINKINAVECALKYTTNIGYILIFI